MAREIEKKGLKFKVNGSDGFWTSFENESWEPNTMNILDKFLTPETTMVDIGAWIGPITLYSASVVNRCYSFEPDPIAFGELAENLQLNPPLQNKITVFNQAITTNGEKVKIFSRYSYGDSGTSLLKRVKSQNQFVEVSSVTFDQFVQANQVKTVDFIKMDVEGAEFFILPTMLDFLKQQKPKFLVSLHPAALNEFLELSYFPLGVLRRIYRFADPKKKFLKKKVANEIKRFLDSLSFYKNCVTGDLKKFDHHQASVDELQQLDMLLFY